MRRIREEKSRRQKIREEKESEERRCRRAKNRKVAKHYVFPVIFDSGGSKSRLAKAAGAEPSGQIRDEKLHAFVARSVFRSHDGLGPLLEVEMSETCTPLWREAHFEVKMCITARSEHLQKLWCRKSARRCGAKHISKSKCKKHTMFGPLFGSWDVEKVHAVVARSTFPSQKCKKMTGTEHFWTFGCRCAWHAQGVVRLVTSQQNVKVL